VARGVLPQLEQDAVVVSWWSFSTPLWYAQFVEGRRPDVMCIDDRTISTRGLGTPTEVIDRHLAERPVYLIRLEGRPARFERALRAEPLPGATGCGRRGSTASYRVSPAADYNRRV
jgi:hypothetical protein